jgi:hypothetical protein
MTERSAREALLAGKMTKRDAFAYFDGAKGRNLRWSWSARSADGRTVVVLLWQRDIVKVGGKLKVHFRYQAWKQGCKELMENLAHARDHCDGLFRVVLSVDKDDAPWKIHRCWPEPGLVMKLIEMIPERGEFRAESVSSKNLPDEIRLADQNSN